jgi:hypothetical protein
VHRYPLDCWRFYPDSSVALVTWAHRCGLPGVVLMESFIDSNDSWGDFVCVNLKDVQYAERYPQRVYTMKPGVTNIRCIDNGAEVVWPAGYVVRPPKQRSLAQRAWQRGRRALGLA